MTLAPRLALAFVCLGCAAPPVPSDEEEGKGDNLKGKTLDFEITEHKRLEMVRSDEVEGEFTMDLVDGDEKHLKSVATRYWIQPGGRKLRFTVNERGSFDTVFGEIGFALFYRPAGSEGDGERVVDRDSGSTLGVPLTLDYFDQITIDVDGRWIYEGLDADGSAHATITPSICPIPMGSEIGIHPVAVDDLWDLDDSFDFSYWLEPL